MMKFWKQTFDEHEFHKLTKIFKIYYEITFSSKNSKTVLVDDLLILKSQT